MYLQAQQNRKTLITDYQQKVSGHEPPQPGSDAHAIPEEQWLAQQQVEFSRTVVVNSPYRRQHFFSTQERGNARMAEITNGDRVFHVFRFV